MDGRSSSTRTAAQLAGDAAERRAADHLESIGWTVLGRNVRVGRKEIDLVGLDPGPPPEVVLVEVRWRARRDFGLGEETFDRRKQAHLRIALGRLVESGALPDGVALPRAPFRIDLIVIEPPVQAGHPARLRHHRHASGG
jgi:Holliday junction resolvase-like predicted endonuclease